MVKTLVDSNKSEEKIMNQKYSITTSKPILFLSTPSALPAPCHVVSPALYSSCSIQSGEMGQWSDDKDKESLARTESVLAHSCTYLK